MAANNNYKALGKMRQLQGAERLGQDRNANFMAAEDIDPNSEPIVTIKCLLNGEAILAEGRRENHDVLIFVEEAIGVPGCRHPRALIVNATNRKILIALYGDASAATLEGKRIQLYVDPRVRNPSGGWTKGIRIRNRVPQVSAQMEQAIPQQMMPMQQGSSGHGPTQMPQYGSSPVPMPAPGMVGGDFGGEYDGF